jgi:adenine deaminase
LKKGVIVYFSGVVLLNYSSKIAWESRMNFPVLKSSFNASCRISRVGDFAAPLPVGGLLSMKSLPEFAGDVRNVEQAIRELGCLNHAPLMQLAFLVLPVIPHLKLTDKGLVDVAKFDFTEV